MLIATRGWRWKLGDRELRMLVAARVVVPIPSGTRGRGCRVCSHCHRQGQGFDPGRHGEHQAGGDEFGTHGVPCTAWQAGYMGSVTDITGVCNTRDSGRKRSG